MQSLRKLSGRAKRPSLEAEPEANANNPGAEPSPLSISRPRKLSMSRGTADSGGTSAPVATAGPSQRGGPAPTSIEMVSATSVPVTLPSLTPTPALMRRPGGSPVPQQGQTHAPGRDPQSAARNSSRRPPVLGPKNQDSVPMSEKPRLSPLPQPNQHPQSSPRARPNAIARPSAPSTPQRTSWGRDLYDLPKLEDGDRTPSWAENGPDSISYSIMRGYTGAGYGPFSYADHPASRDIRSSHYSPSSSMLPFMFDKSDAESLSPPSFPNSPSHSRTNSHYQFPVGAGMSNGNSNSTGSSTPTGPGIPHHALSHGVSSPLARGSPAPKYEPHFLFAVYRDSATPPDPDDALHEPDLDQKGNELGHDLPRGHRLRGAVQPFVPFSLRGAANMLTLIAVMLGVFMLFPGYFIYSAVTTHNYFSRGGNLVGYVTFETLGGVTVARAGTSLLGLAPGTPAAVAAATTTTDFLGPTETDSDTVPTATADTALPVAATIPAAASIATAATPTETDTGDDGDNNGDDDGSGTGGGGGGARRRRGGPTSFITSAPSS